MTDDDLLTRLRGRLTGLDLKWVRLVSQADVDAVLDALRPECEQIASEMAGHVQSWTEAFEAQETRSRQAESPRVALRQALQQAVKDLNQIAVYTHDCRDEVRPYAQSPLIVILNTIYKRLRDATDAAEALLAHEPPETT